MTTTRFAIAAVATALMGSTAIAADLGGNCCADLEERIAELEATTVRKGNRKVSLAISGYVSHHVMFWDDGGQSDVYFGDGSNYGSRWRFRGEAKINHELTAGFLYEFGHNANALGSLNQLNNGQDLGASGPAGTAGVTTDSCGNQNPRSNSQGCSILRDATVWLRHARLGEIRIGHGSTATDNLILIDLGGVVGAASPDIGLFNGGFRLRNTNGSLTGSTGGIASDGVGIVAITWANLITGGAESWDTARRNGLRYETPTLHGFTLQAAVAEDNFWDVALRYAGEFNGVRLAFGIGYREDTAFNSASQFAGIAPNALCASNCDRKESGWMGSASVLHVPTGLFLTGAAGSRDREGNITDAGLGSVDNRNISQDFWYLSGGIAKNHFGIGNTVLYAEYGEYNDALRFLFTDVTASQTTMWGIGAVQYIDAAAMEIFIAYKSYEGEFSRNNGTLAAPIISKVNFQDFSTVIIGTRIAF